MTVSAVHVAALRNLMLAGYTGAGLLDAFERLCAEVIAPLLAGAPAGAAPSPLVSPVCDTTSDVTRKSGVTRQRGVAGDVLAGTDFVEAAPPENGKAIALKAIAGSRLGGRDKAVMARLIEHYNLATGRCDPGIKALCRGVAFAGDKSEDARKRAVYRALAALEAGGWVRRYRHGGRSLASRYVPNWAGMAARVTVTDLSQRGDGFVTQNHLRKPDSISVAVAPAVRRGKRREPDRRQIPMMYPLAGGKAVAAERASGPVPRAEPVAPPVLQPVKQLTAMRTVDARDAAEAAAQRRLFVWMRTSFSDPAVMAHVLDLDADVHATAVRAEMGRHGAGQAVIRQALEGVAGTGQRLGRTGTGPP